MNKLSREQADWLIEKLKGAADDMDPISYNGMYHPSDVNRIIRACIKQNNEDRGLVSGRSDDD